MLFLFQAGIILDNGVKTTQANDKDKRPFLSLVGARSDSPHSVTNKHAELQAEVITASITQHDGFVISNRDVFLSMFCY